MTIREEWFYYQARTYSVFAVLLTLLPFTVFALTYWLGGWATFGEPPLPLLVFVVGSLLSLLLGASLALFILFITAVAQGTPLGIESSWGGFGGGLGGWRISRPLAFFLGALFFAGVFATLSIQISQHEAFRKWAGVTVAEETEERPAEPEEPPVTEERKEEAQAEPATGTTSEDGEDDAGAE